MADEKLPEWLTDVMLDWRGCGCCKGDATRDEVDAAIHRYAREREAAALERCLKIADQYADINAHGDANDALRISGAIRALIHKEPANG